MWNLSLMAIAGLCAALLTPVAWLLVRLTGLLPPLVRLLALQIWPLHCMAGLFGCLVGGLLLVILKRFSGRAGHVMVVAGGCGGAAVSSLVFFPLVALF